MVNGKFHITSHHYIILLCITCCCGKFIALQIHITDVIWEITTTKWTSHVNWPCSWIFGRSRLFLCISSQFDFQFDNTTLPYWLENCQVQENNRGNSGNSGHQVQTYEMLEGTLASAYVLCPFQTLVPRFWNEKDRGLELFLEKNFRRWGSRWELIQYSNWNIYMASPRYLY